MPPRRRVNMASQPKLSARARLELESTANGEFRSVVRRRANRIKLGLVEQLRAQCARAGVDLIGPKLQYRADDPNRGRYYVVSSAPFPGHTRKLFRYVSDPLSSRDLVELEDWRVAREYQDEGLRPIRLGISSQPLGTAAFLMGIGLEPRYHPRANARLSVAPRTGRSSRRPRVSTNSTTRAINPSRVRQAGTRRGPPQVQPRRRSPSVEVIENRRRARSPSIEVVEAPLAAPVIDLTFASQYLRVLYYPTPQAEPVKLALEQLYPGASYELKSYAPQWNAIEVKLSEAVMLLTASNAGVNAWHATTLGDLALPSSAKRVILARRTDQSSDFEGVCAYASWAYKGRILPISITIDD